MNVLFENIFENISKSIATRALKFGGMVDIGIHQITHKFGNFSDVSLKMVIFLNFGSNFQQLYLGNYIE